MPLQNRIRREQRDDFLESPPAEQFAERSFTVILQIPRELSTAWPTSSGETGTDG